MLREEPPGPQRHYSDTLDILGAEGVLARAQRTPRSAENLNLTFGLRSSGRLSPNGVGLPRS
jgi:hypothetical protein